MVSEYGPGSLSIEKRKQGKKLSTEEKPDKSGIFAVIRENFSTRHLGKRTGVGGEQLSTSPGQESKEKTPAGPRQSIARAGAPEAFSGMPLEVNWGITYMCNYNCSYCFGHDPLDRSRFTSWAYLKKAVDHIAELNRDTVRFTFGGGEPTTHPDLGRLIEYIHRTFAKRLESVHVISNGSRNPQFYDRLAENEEIDRVHFNISLHTESMELDHITSLIERLSHKAPLYFSLMFHPQKKDFVTLIHHELCRLRASYPFELGVLLLRRRPRFDRLDERYTSQDFAWRDRAAAEFGRAALAGPPIVYPPQRGYRGELFWNYADPARPYKKMEGKDRDTLFAEGDFNFRGMYCIPGSSLVCIDPDGSVSGARCGQAPKSHNIFEENPYRHKDFIYPLRCSAANCGCSTNDQLPKFASREEARDFAEMYTFKQAERLAL